MTCREFADFMSDYLSGELSPRVRARFDDHLRICENCRRYLASYGESVRLGRLAFDDDMEPVPSHVPEDFVRAVLDARRSA